MSYATNLFERLGKALGLKKAAAAPAQGSAAADEPASTDTPRGEPTVAEASVVRAIAGA